MKIKGKNGISLIVLVITVIILSILATTVIISLSNTNVIDKTSKTVFKSDMSSYKEAYETYVINRFASDINFNRKELNLTYADAEFSDIFENVPEKYKEGLKIVNGDLVYESTDASENEVLEAMGMKTPEYISKDESYVGYFADIDGDGKVDGVIFADLCEGGSGEVSEGGMEAIQYTIPTIEETDAKNYYISKTSYTAPEYTSYGAHPVITAYGKGEERFYVIALENATNNLLYWYYNAAENSQLKTDSITSVDFGAGRTNTHAMITAWNAETYGDHYADENYSDLWGKIQTQVYAGKSLELQNVKWFVPSAAELNTFSNVLGDVITFSSDYWSSSLADGRLLAWQLEGGSDGSFFMESLQIVARVRLVATF